MEPLQAVVFQAALALGALLFGVFGFLYTLRATLLTLTTGGRPDVPPVVHRLRPLCQATAAPVVASVAVAALALLNLAVGLLVWALVAILAVTAGLALRLAFERE